MILIKINNNNLIKKKIINNNNNLISSHKNSLIYNPKTRTNSNSWSLKSHEKMTIMNNFISNKDNDSKSNMKINMMILLIMTKDHCLWTLLPVTLKAKKKLKCKGLYQIKIIKKLIN